MNIGLKWANRFQSGWVRWWETDGHQCCRSPRSFGNQVENHTVALLCDLHKLAIIWYYLIYICLPQNISRKSDPLIWPLLGHAGLSVVVQTRRSAVHCQGLATENIRILVCSFLLADWAISWWPFSFLTCVFASCSGCSSFAWGAAAWQRGWTCGGDAGAAGGGGTGSWRCCLLATVDS